MPGDTRASAPAETALAIVMPALDEEATVGAQVLALRAHPAFQALPLGRIIVVDNGSRDRTAEVARAAGAQVVREPRRGYGYACLAGVRAASAADVVLLMDADGSDDFDGAARVARLVLAGEADIAMGMRTTGRRERSALTPQQRIGNGVGALALQLLYGARVSDIAPVRAIGREALLALDPHEMSYGWSTEMLAKAARAGLRIVEVPVAAHPRAGGKSKVAGTLRGTVGASVHILRTLWRYRAWRPSNGVGRPAGDTSKVQLAVKTAPMGYAAVVAGEPAVETERVEHAATDAAAAAAAPGPTVETAPEGRAAAESTSADWVRRGGVADRRALFVVARLPVAGQTKTRLGQAIGHETAAALYRAFLRDLSTRLNAAAATVGYDLFWYYAAPPDACEAAFAACVAVEGESGRATTETASANSVGSSSILPSPPQRRGAGGEDRSYVQYIRQPEGDFAARLWHGFAQLAARGYGRIVVLGSDSPQVPTAHIAAAFNALETHDVALGPARDGGYYLLGQRGRPADLFSGIQMSTPRVAAETMARAAALGLSVAMLPESFDVDEPEDLDTLARALASAPWAEADPAPATYAALAEILAAGTAVRKSAPALRTSPAPGSHSATSQLAEGVAHGAA